MLSRFLASTDYPADPASCNATCSSDQGSQLCGSGQHSTANLYTLPSSLSTSGSKLPCSFAFNVDATPTLSAASAAILDVNGSLILTGTKFASGTRPPTVEVCSGRTCAVVTYDATSITCTMPDCPAASTASPILVHVPPMGYASQDGSIVVGGGLSITAVSGPAANGKAAGSAAGGALLTIHGTGFESDPLLMKVSLRAISGSTASCAVLTSGRGSLQCLTGPTATPLADVGTKMTVHVATLVSSNGNEAASVALADGYQLLADADSMTLTGLSVTAGSVQGGLLVCASGTKLDAGGATLTVTLGEAPCDMGNLTQNATQLCCTTSTAATAGVVAARVHTPQLGNALTASGMPTFEYKAAPAVHAISPTSGNAGSVLTLTMDSPASGLPSPEVAIGGYSCNSVQAVDNGDGSTTLRVRAT